MLERLKEANKYLGSAVNRAIGRAAWGEAMRGPGLGMDAYLGDDRPAWAKAISRALDHGAPLYAALEITVPATSRLISPILRATYTEAMGRKNNLRAVLAVPAMAFDMALNSTILFSVSSLPEMMAWKFFANEATHIGLDVAGTMVDKIKNHRPSTTTLAV